MSALYFDVLKDRLYTGATRGKPRRSGQTALYKVHYALVRLMAPLLSFTAEEAWSFTAEARGRAGQRSPGAVARSRKKSRTASMRPNSPIGSAHAAREPVLKALEEARQAKLIGTSLEARVRMAPRSS